MSQTIPIDPVTPDPGSIIQAGKIIQNNGVVIFPAKCLYGIAVRALDDHTPARVFAAKQRPLDKPILVLIPDQTMLPDLVTAIPETAVKLMAAFWPGNLTLIFKARSHIPEILTAGTGRIGIRLPLHPVAKALVECVGFPITGTSANLSGNVGCSRPDHLDPAVTASVDLILDAGTLKGGPGSTVVDVTTTPVRILRQGEVSADQIRKVLGK
jgi:L-threonylcarbamoyladenylate synthase